MIDPVDDCTFWYAGEYFAVDGLNNWHTRIGSFALPGCVPVAISLSSLGVNPGLVQGGQPATGTVSLTAPAPAGGVTVTLSSSNTAVATVPASATVAAGATSAGFTIATSSVTASASVTVTASSGDVTRSAALTVNPAAGACAAGRSNVTLSVTGPAGTVTSSPSGLNVSSGNTGSACFTNNNRVELMASRSVTEELLGSVQFDDVAKGRRGTVLVKVDAGGIPIVRTTTPRERRDGLRVPTDLLHDQ